MGGAKVAVKLQSGVSTPVDRSKVCARVYLSVQVEALLALSERVKYALEYLQGSISSTRRSAERKAPAVSGTSVGSSVSSRVPSAHCTVVTMPPHIDGVNSDPYESLCMRGGRGCGHRVSVK